ncbi:GNAT family N-acetyltransferase [Vibrio ostreicida]|uniref:GNAT family N-acetyltransferase n=1 Tax=Vibrio ostreicida TaxID=526588 RepID=A0ABT8BT41_9VIBR|nr:GNAT family N-acetyltransferase [Vibrio ostreicida]MDN3609838.1 GNAT family N-acetyltransferase [Vibrio ostreicida]NPD09341.1 GNAT family N-acetyltransferase [Vibrio ostreicida]
MNIVTASPTDLTSFFNYLDRQLVENVAESGVLFQPLAKEHNHVSESLRSKFRMGFESPLGAASWRKLWLAKDDSGAICGHVDLRHHSEQYSFHRVLLGMGVASWCRQQGVGLSLMETIIKFCHQSPAIDWLDLNVLSNNTPAQQLYLKCGFSVIGEVKDFYRVDGQSLSEISMTLITKS